MSNIPEIKPSPINKKRAILFVAFPGMCLLDIAGPQTAFWVASRSMEARGLPGYARHTVSMDGGLVRTLEGVALDTLAITDFIEAEIDTIIIPGAPNIELVVDQSAELVEWLRLTANATRRIASVCTGAFMLARAGLLEGKRAATHWAYCGLLKKNYPTVDVDSDAIFVRQDKIWTSAGVTAGIDLSLALVEADCGREIALGVAKELVVFLKRPGGQAQFSMLLKSQATDNAVFDDLHLWIAQNLNSDSLTVEYLAERSRMSTRNFARVYKEKTGRTPAKAVEIFRLEAARRLLEDSSRNIDQIARLSGFGDEERMRVTFQRNLGISPTEYRKRFSPEACI